MLSKNKNNVSQYKDLTFNKNLKTDDITSNVIGDFGRWQLRISLLMALLKLPIAWYQLNIIFMSPPQKFWCVKPETFASYSNEEWRKMCSPRIEEHPCLIYDPDILAIAPTIDKSLIPLVACNRFIYDQTVFTRTITSDWDLVCTKHWMIHLTQCVMMWGIVIGGILFGILADIYGRKLPLIICLVIQGITSFLASFISLYYWFLATWFVLALASGGVGIISFVICMEIVGGKYRTIIPVVYQLPFGLGNAAMAGLAYWLRDWRKLEFALATFSSLFILYWFWIPESPRWLIATGQTEKAFVRSLSASDIAKCLPIFLSFLEVLKKAALENGNHCSFGEFKQLLEITKKVQKNKDPGFMIFFHSKNMRQKTFLLSINWFCTGLAFYTFSQYLGSIGENIFLTVALTGFISTLGAITCIFIITKVGRKTTVGIYQFITAACFVMLLLIPRELFSSDWPRLLFAGIGFAGMAGSIPALYLFSGELFPTLGRNVGVSGVSTFARIASMTAPAIVGLDALIPDFPLILLAITSVLQILMIIPLPETKDKPLPDTVEQAEEF